MRSSLRPALTLGAAVALATPLLCVGPAQALAPAASAAQATTAAPAAAAPAAVPPGNTFHLADNDLRRTSHVLTYGRPGDEILVGDWDGDGTDTLAVRRGTTVHVSNSLTGGDADAVVTYGRPGDEILVGDWDGDGTDTLAVRRGGEYFLKDSISSGPADRVLRFGRATDTVVVGDWDGDGVDALAVRRGAHYLINTTMRSGPADTVVCYGRDADDVYVGDWDGSGEDALAVRRGARYHLAHQLRNGPADRSVAFGRPGDVTLVGDWDGDGTDSLAVRRSSGTPSDPVVVPGDPDGPTDPVDPGQPEPDFDQPLSIPPLADSVVDEDGTRVFQLTAQAGTTSFRDGVETETWGFNGDFLGPTLRARRGEQVAVEVTNTLGESTSVHWHGMHLPPEMDGGPHQEVEAGGTWRPTWLIDQPAATLWYHPHPHGRTEKHVYLGMSGMFILDDDEADTVGLPDEYGVDDIPVIVQDKSFTEDGQLTMESPVPSGVMGEALMVNGTIGAVQEVTTERVRLRLLNGSTLRSYNFGFDDDRSFQLVASDGGLLPAPHETNRVQLTPGERAEIVVEMEPGSETMLRSYPQQLGEIADPDGYGALDTLDVLRLEAADELAPSAVVAGELSDHERLDEADAATTRTFVMKGLALNGQRMDMNRIDEVVTVDTTEVWVVRNEDPMPHNFHIHDVQFEVLSVDGAPPPPELSGRKDTIYTEPGREYRLIMRFEHYANPEMPYMYHCHLLRHEDFGLMGQFVVVEPGTEPPTTLPGPGHDHH
ncbi:Multicopper oxidase with three cupredoxin domains (includes cell division protein FtsP and spore coat protein CotA) [Georgenia satyanarayanai]|uniref:Multicopper oxidase with three cupredoxin domains (Includes cell division protein FtsP and spore coat protein CotA) n=1 Tax=Georgenia satyanarayanai TaxID=860221 RepID=A0A2Y9C7W9_9MICO|nr:multicopper oxidase domain-containing protein [Georgenia satyanarayanai]PYF96331.1 FtsP/CotA-like multicopper oxidase with cupredoxin domain [Georgenia satyanarayanai]SSA47053.1 Multicopper oxidase with three cupredoxin domains (includes cell division protein FtsP and spore coat protein CotA) [Georgenia satyanarayanai]